MAGKKLAFYLEAREQIKAGVDKLIEAVRTTYGPRGRHVMIEKSFGSPDITRDGMTVAKEIELEDKSADIGVTVLRQAAFKTAEEAGDGTTTACILAGALLDEGIRNVAAGADPMALSRGIERGLAEALKVIDKMSTPVKGRKDLTRIGTIASGNDPDIGERIGEAMERAGAEGVITVEEGKTLDSSIDWVEGMQFDRGYLSPYFVTDKKGMKTVLEKPLILVHEKKISNVQEFVPLLEKVAQSGRSVLVIAENVEGEALATLVVNKLRGTLKCAAVKAPSYGDKRKAQLADIAALTGAKAVFEDTGLKLEELQLSDLGTAKKVEIDKENTTIVEGGGAKEDIQGRIAQINAEMETTDSNYDKEQLQKRLAKLAGGVAQITVGGATEAEVKTRKARTENALSAAQAAAESGVVPGGGVVFLRAASKVAGLKLKGAEKLGAKILTRALEAPMRQLARNSGAAADVVVEKVLAKKDAFGYDVVAGKYTDLAKAGVYDPAKVVKSALTNAVSAATMLLTTEASITVIPEKKKTPAAPEDMYGDGMY
jgi:chaperonin GroEL